MKATAEKPLHLVSLSVENFLRVQALTIDADGKHVKISGKNGAGKTSAVDAIWWALKSSAAGASEPIHKGADKATVRLDLGEFQVERKATDKTTSLVVTASDGSRLSKPQQILDGLLGAYSLDPCAFLMRRPQEQIADVLAIAGIEPPVDRVAEITGERIPAKDGETADAYLDRLAGDGGVFYMRRREAHRQLERGENVIQNARRQLEQMPEATDIKPASELIVEIDRLQKQDSERRIAAIQAQEADAARAEACDRLASLKERRRILFDEIRELDARIAKGEEIIPQLLKDSEDASKLADSIPDPSAKLAELRAKLAASEQASAASIQRKQAEENVKRLAADLAVVRDEHAAAAKIIDDLRAARAALLQGVDLGIPGLEISSGELRLNGVPLRQASQAEQIRLACAVAMAQAPRLKLLRIDEGERLDDDSKAQVLALAEEKGWQVIMTTVANTDGLKVEIVE